MSSRITGPLTFQLPIPDKALSPNARAHWSVKARAVRAARLLAKVEARRVLNGSEPPEWGTARYRAVLFHVSQRTPDPTNFEASLKAYIDGLADAFVIANDRDLWPERTAYVRVERLPHIEITITPEA